VDDGLGTMIHCALSGGIRLLIQAETVLRLKINFSSKVALLLSSGRDCRLYLF
jgi:hypothetical protein